MHETSCSHAKPVTIDIYDELNITRDRPVYIVPECTTVMRCQNSDCCARVRPCVPREGTRIMTTKTVSIMHESGRRVHCLSTLCDHCTYLSTCTKSCDHYTCLKVNVEKWIRDKRLACCCCNNWQLKLWGNLFFAHNHKRLKRKTHTF